MEIRAFNIRNRGVSDNRPLGSSILSAEKDIVANNTDIINFNISAQLCFINISIHSNPRKKVSRSPYYIVGNSPLRVDGTDYRKRRICSGNI